MAVDVRREMAHIWDEFDTYHRTLGEEVIWFQFDTVNSRYDEVYDEGGKTYLRGIRMPILWVDQIEEPEQWTDQGRRPQQRLRFAISARTLLGKGISTRESHGRTLDIAKRDNYPLPEEHGRTVVPWFDDRLNDVIYYDKRFYAVSNFQIRGRAKYDDVIIGISALETVVEDETVWDLFPENTPYGEAWSSPISSPGSALVAVLGETSEWKFTFDLGESEPVGDWVFDITNEDSTYTWSSIPLVLEDLGDGTWGVTVEIDHETLANLYSQMEYQELFWRIVQNNTESPRPHTIWVGRLLIVTDPFDYRQYTYTSPSDPDDHDVTIRVSPDASSIFTLSLGDDPLIGEWSGLIMDMDSGSPSGDLEVDTSLLELGRVGMYFPIEMLEVLDPDKTYRWVVVQLHNGDTVTISGPLIIDGD